MAGTRGRCECLLCKTDGIKCKTRPGFVRSKQKRIFWLSMYEFQTWIACAVETALHHDLPILTNICVSLRLPIQCIQEIAESNAILGTVNFTNDSYRAGM